MSRALDLFRQRQRERLENLTTDNLPKASKEAQDVSYMALQTALSRISPNDASLAKLLGLIPAKQVKQFIETARDILNAYDEELAKLENDV